MMRCSTSYMQTHSISFYCYNSSKFLDAVVCNGNSYMLHVKLVLKISHTLFITLSTTLSGYINDPDMVKSQENVLRMYN